VLSVYLLAYGSLTSQPTPIGAIKHSIDSRSAVGAVLSAREKKQVAFVTSLIETHQPALEDSDSLATLIVTESKRARIDPLFVAAVIQAESSFRPAAVSYRGAKGLMQLMPATGRHLSKQLNVYLKDATALHDPKTNIKLGIAYLKELNRRFKGDKEHALVAYNWGPTNVSRALGGHKKFPRSSVKYARSILSRSSSWALKMNHFVAQTSLSSFG
jgi:soluble lytic murein transglycosylase-like protein